MAFKKIIIKKQEPKPVPDPNQIDLEESIKEVKKRPKNIGRLVPLDELIAKVNALPPVTSSDLRPDIIKWDGMPYVDDPNQNRALRGAVWAIDSFNPFEANKLVLIMFNEQDTGNRHIRKCYSLNEDWSPQELRGQPIREAIASYRFAKYLGGAIGPLGLQ